MFILFNQKKYEKNLILFNLISAVKWLHSQGIIHNDLKPENIMIENNLHIKIIDFGFSIKKKNDSDFQKNTKGTPLYLAPEKIKSSPHDGIFN